MIASEFLFDLVWATTMLNNGPGATSLSEVVNYDWERAPAEY